MSLLIPHFKSFLALNPDNPRKCPDPQALPPSPGPQQQQATSSYPNPFILVLLSNACSKRNLRLRIPIPLHQTHYNYIFFSFLFHLVHKIIIIIHYIAHISHIRLHYSLIHSLIFVFSSPFPPHENCHSQRVTTSPHISTHNSALSHRDDPHLNSHFSLALPTPGVLAFGFGGT